MLYYGSRISENMTKTPEGYLICMNVPINRIGSQEYLGSELQLDSRDGNQRINVLRDENEVFDRATLASFEGKPVCNEHPTEDVDISNNNIYQVGHCQNVRREGDYTIADLYITNPEMIQEIENGKREISCGYTCDFEDNGDGTYSQTNIRGNHIAVVNSGRAGETVRINDAVNKESYFKSKFDILTRNYDEDRAESLQEELEKAFGKGEVSRAFFNSYDSKLDNIEKYIKDSEVKDSIPFELQQDIYDLAEKIKNKSISKKEAIFRFNEIKHKFDRDADNYEQNKYREFFTGGANMINKLSDSSVKDENSDNKVRREIDNLYQKYGHYSKPAFRNMNMRELQKLWDRVDLYYTYDDIRKQPNTSGTYMRKLYDIQSAIEEVMVDKDPRNSRAFDSNVNDNVPVGVTVSKGYMELEKLIRPNSKSNKNEVLSKIQQYKNDGKITEKEKKSLELLLSNATKFGWVKDSNYASQLKGILDAMYVKDYNYESYSQLWDDMENADSKEEIPTFANGANDLLRKGKISKDQYYRLQAKIVELKKKFTNIGFFKK